MANNTDNNEGCSGCLFWLFVLLGFGNPFFWVIAFILYIFSNSSQSSSPSAPGPEGPNPPDDLNNILIHLSQGEIRDPVSQDIFRPNEQVYLCYIHRLAYHEDSWREMGCKCMVCGNNGHVKIHTVPVPMQIPREENQKSDIIFIDITNQDQ